VVAPHLRDAILGFKQESERLASIRIRVSGGVVVFITAYAPHSGRSCEERRDFYENLSAFYEAERSHGPCFILGDMNARLHTVRLGEEDILGPGVFGNS